MTLAPNTQSGLGRKVFNRLLHSYFQATRGLTIGVRAVVRFEDGNFLLVRHTYIPGWHFPGGGVEKGRTSRHTLDKELRQETGLELTGKPKLHGVFFNSAVSRRDHILVYLCDFKGELTDRPTSMEIAEVGLFGLDDLPAGTDPGTARRMREIVEGTEPHDEW
ncbi:MAG: NUDIX domain-containing protein [Rhodobacteraceae bacterium]|nr:NUDIX domain-containing protein [Paracoccaceae bacterium]